MRRLSFLAAVFIILASIIAGAELKLANETLRVKNYTFRSGKKTISIEYCQYSSCTPIGKPTGYTLKEWDELEDGCRADSIYFEPMKVAFKDQVIPLAAAGVAILPGYFRVIGIIAIGAANFSVRNASRENSEAKAVVSDRMAGIVRNDNFPISSDLFNKTRRGFELCTQQFDEVTKQIKEYNECKKATFGTAIGCQSPYAPPIEY